MGKKLSNKKYSEEIKRKVSLVKKERKFSKEHRERLSKALKGRIFSKDHKLNIKKAAKNNPNAGMRGKKHSDEVKKKMSNSHKGHISWNKGIPMTEEAKLKSSNFLKGKKFSKDKYQNFGMRNKKHSKETKNKMSIAKKGKIFSEDHKLNIKKAAKNNPNFGRRGKKFKHSEEAKKKIGLANKGRKFSKKTRQKMSKSRLGNNNPNFGKKLSKLTRKKISEAHKGFKHTKESIEKMSINIKKAAKNNPNFGNRGKKMSDETKKKMSISKSNISKETREKLRIAMSKRVMPMKDSKIELKIQDFLTLLRIEFITHKYMKIKNAYQCDILIPKQKGIQQKMIIECDGDFYHMNPKQFKPNDKIFKNGIKAKEKWKIDNDRTKQLIEQGFRVIRLWENKIKVMELKDFKEIIKENKK